MTAYTFLRNDIEQIKQSKTLSSMTEKERLIYFKQNDETFRSQYSSINNEEFRFILLDKTIIGLNIVSDIDINSKQAIIVYESASGDGGITINNGRLQETIPISGKILANNNKDLLAKCLKIMTIKESGETIEFDTPFTGIRGDKSNKFYIESVEFNATKSTPTSMPFTIILSENRMANVKTTAVNLVNYQSAELMRQFYNNLVGNI